MAVGLHRLTGCEGGLEDLALILGERLIEVDHVACERCQIHRLERFALASGLGARDVEKRVEGADHGLGVAQRLLQYRPQRLAAVADQRHLDARTHPVERRSEIMGDVVGDLAHAVQEPFDLIEHGVEIGGELIELVAARPVERDPPAEVARHDLFGGAVDAIDPAQHPAAHQEAAGKPEQKREPEPPGEGMLDPGLQLQSFLDLAAHQQAVAAGEAKALGDRAAVLADLTIELDRHRKGQPIVLAKCCVRPAVDIAGDPAAGRVGQKIDAGAVGLGSASLLDHLAKARQALRPVLLGEPGDLRLDGLGGLPGHEAGGGDVEIAEQNQRRHGEQAEIDQRQPKGGGVKKPDRAHADNIRHRAPYGSAAGRNRGRSSGEGG